MGQEKRQRVSNIFGRRIRKIEDRWSGGERREVRIDGGDDGFLVTSVFVEVDGGAADASG